MVVGIVKECRTFGPTLSRSGEWNRSHNEYSYVGREQYSSLLFART